MPFVGLKSLCHKTRQGVSLALKQVLLCSMAMTALIGLVGPAYAQSGSAAPALQILAAKVNPLPLFNKPGESSPAKTLVPEGFPWTVLEDKQDFYRVKVGERDYWVDSLNVRTAQTVKAKCTLGQNNKNQPVAATMGAGSNPCAAP